MRYSAAAERVLKIFYPQAAQRQGGFSSLMSMLAEHLEPPETVILRGESICAIALEASTGAAFRPSSNGAGDSVGDTKINRNLGQTRA